MPLSGVEVQAFWPLAPQQKQVFIQAEERARAGSLFRFAITSRPRRPAWLPTRPCFRRFFLKERWGMRPGKLTVCRTRCNACCKGKSFEILGKAGVTRYCALPSPQWKV